MKLLNAILILFFVIIIGGMIEKALAIPSVNSKNAVIFSCPIPDHPSTNELWLVHGQIYMVGHPDYLFGNIGAVKTFQDILKKEHNIYFDPQCDGKYDNFIEEHQ